MSFLLNKLKLEDEENRDWAEAKLQLSSVADPKLQKSAKAVKYIIETAEALDKKNENNDDLFTIADHSYKVFKILKDRSNGDKSEGQPVLKTVYITYTVNVFTKLKEIFGFGKQEPSVSVIEDFGAIERDLENVSNAFSKYSTKEQKVS
ncbi:hypothetical protein VKT23_017713 [Stygiomarasmius scandens]|uniref:Uncharacterized protein n=1 Tax=Marasmiellus scandens TaxID=2682957 RepID=A0ABR1IR49_9AGAR